MELRKRHHQTLSSIFARPVRSSIVFDDALSLLRALGAQVIEREGSRVAFVLNGRLSVFHKPHPRKEMDKGAVAALRDFLISAGITP